MLEVGTHVADRYVVEALIGSGGLAHVYRVRHIELGSAHALKVLAWDTPALAARMLQEGRIQAQLRHPNLVRVTDVLRDGGLVGLLMEYIEGQTLEQHIHEHGAMSVDETLALMAPILGAAAVAHDAEVLHRDLKPANVMLEPRGSSFSPKVMDFGIAKAMADSGGGSSTRPNAMLGTPEYMAPEQFLDAGQVTPAVDVFALAVMVQYCLTGQGAFEPSGVGKPLVELLIRQPRPLPDGLPPSVHDAIRKGMASEPSDRFAHARDFAKALFQDDPALLRVVGERAETASGLDPQAFTTGAPVVRTRQQGNPPPSPTITPMGSAPFNPPALRRSKTPLLVGVLLMVGVVGLIGWWMTQNPAVPEGPIYPPVTDVVAPELPPILGPSDDSDSDALTTDIGVDTDELEPSTPQDEPVEDGQVAAAQTEPVAVLPTQPELEADTEVVLEADTEAVAVAPEPVAAEPVVPEPVVVPVPAQPVVSVVAVGEAEPEPEVERVDIGGRWVGTADGRPLVLSLRQGIDGTVTGDLNFTLGTTQRSFAVIGTVDGERVTLDAGSAFRFVGALRNGELGGTYTARQRSRSFPWTTTRD